MNTPKRMVWTDKATAYFLKLRKQYSLDMRKVHEHWLAEPLSSPTEQVPTLRQLTDKHYKLINSIKMEVEFEQSSTEALLIGVAENAFMHSTQIMAEQTNNLANNIAHQANNLANNIAQHISQHVATERRVWVDSVSEIVSPKKRKIDETPVEERENIERYTSPKTPKLSEDEICIQREAERARRNLPGTSKLTYVAESIPDDGTYIPEAGKSEEPFPDTVEAPHTTSEWDTPEHKMEELPQIDNHIRLEEDIEAEQSINNCITDRAQLKPISSFLGYDRAKDQMSDLVEQVIAGKGTRNIMLYGPPGTGKTSMAKAIAWKFDMPVFFVTQNVVSSRYKGTGAKLVQALLARATEEAPSMIIFDDVDALLSTREKSHGDAMNGEKATLMGLSQSVMDSKAKVIMVVTTNTPWDIDSAFIRRFKYHIYMGCPCEETLRRICTSEVEARKEDNVIFPDLDLELLVTAMHKERFTAGAVELLFEWLISEQRLNFALPCNRDKKFKDRTVVKVPTISITQEMIVTALANLFYPILTKENVEKFEQWQKRR